MSSAQRPSPTTFVLVHGSFTSAWCWRAVVPHLEQRGHRVVTLDLPAHGADPTAVNDATLAGYVEAVLRIVTAQPAPPILVGHSFCGTIAGVTESAPDAVSALVFVAGLLPPNGGAAMEAVAQFDPAYLAQAVWAPDRRSVRVSAQGTRDFLCSTSPASVVEEVVARMAPEPIAPYETPITTTDARFGRTRRYYIETLHDRVVPLAMQRIIQERVGVRRVFSLHTDHVPHLSAPGDLASCLDEIALDVDLDRRRQAATL